ncbi:hypothetical protein BB561_001070 [Smittium simulii]|uniref:DUF866 domain-containing protein n=1 Tax=Smittium simulii TaxID=133385 RepID=A0A2T9YWE0_9FUNG|nr:hypothetical protein BB561_001070 [Smittium simulii]
MKCTHCQEKTEGYVTLCATDQIEMQGTIIEGPFPYPEEKSNKFFTIAVFDCRGLEPVEFKPYGEWRAIGLESGAGFNEIDLSDDDWADYDDKVIFH